MWAADHATKSCRRDLRSLGIRLNIHDWWWKTSREIERDFSPLQGLGSMLWDVNPGLLRFALGYRIPPLQGYASGELRTTRDGEMRSVEGAGSGDPRTTENWPSDCWVGRRALTNSKNTPPLTLPIEGAGTGRIRCGGVRMQRIASADADCGQYQERRGCWLWDGGVFARTCAAAGGQAEAAAQRV